jgi:hypothetical protein
MEQAASIVFDIVLDRSLNKVLWDLKIDGKHRPDVPPVNLAFRREFFETMSNLDLQIGLALMDFFK